MSVITETEDMQRAEEKSESTNNQSGEKNMSEENSSKSNKLAEALRKKPDYMIIGEIRDEAAFIKGLVTTPVPNYVYSTNVQIDLH